MEKKSVKTTKVNFSKAILKDIEGSIITTPIYKELANMIYRLTGDLGMLDIAKTIYDGKEVELTEKQLEEVKAIINFDKGGVALAAFVRRDLMEFIEKC